MLYKIEIVSIEQKDGVADLIPPEEGFKIDKVTFVEVEKEFDKDGFVQSKEYVFSIIWVKPE